jgi:hypothetical protein
MKRPSLILSGLALTGVITAGCHELQPHRLQRLNRGPGLSTEAYYSIPDPSPGCQAVESHASDAEPEACTGVCTPAPRR